MYNTCIYNIDGVNSSMKLLFRGSKANTYVTLAGGYEHKLILVMAS